MSHDLDAIREAAENSGRARLAETGHQTSAAFTELAAKTLRSAAKRAAATATTPSPEGTTPLAPPAAGEGAVGAATPVPGRAGAARSTSQTTRPRADTQGRSSNTTATRKRPVAAERAPGRAQKGR